MRISGLCMFLLPALLCLNLQAQRPPKAIRHVVVIGVDGMSPDGIHQANTPHMDRLMREGAWTLHARSVTPSSSSPNWASIIMGADVEQHGIHSNDYERDDYILPPVVRGNADIFPTIFGEIHQQMPRAEIGAIYEWGGFGRLFEKEAVDYNQRASSEAAAAQLASDYIVAKRPTFCFVHLDHVDHAGHIAGHGTAKYYRSVERADSLIGQILEAIVRAGIADETLVLICADHGGKGHGHGGLTMAEMEVPLILYGPGVKKGYELPIPVFQYDHAATVAFALGVEAPMPGLAGHRAAPSKVLKCPPATMRWPLYSKGRSFFMVKKATSPQAACSGATPWCRSRTRSRAKSAIPSMAAPRDPGLRCTKKPFPSASRRW
ncbi:MAG: alkaline phosphatase [Bacteroidetes bacterium]|nr:MAG: alkaline phosphatase [Bacteroidota bacterium]